MTENRPLSFPVISLKQKKQKYFFKKEGFFNVIVVLLVLPDKK